jgi:hypothetical protein
LEVRELAVDRNPQGLKDARGGVNLVASRRSARQGVGDGRHEIFGRPFR